jgi:hypothetical protein
MEMSDADRTFEAIKNDLLNLFPGQFALVCGRRLLGVYVSVNEAMASMSESFAAGELPEGTPVLISEIAAQATVRVQATPARRPTAPPVL